MARVGPLGMGNGASALSEIARLSFACPMGPRSCHEEGGHLGVLAEKSPQSPTQNEVRPSGPPPRDSTEGCLDSHQDCP